jgi:nucleoid DNA-binding protein
MTKAELISNIAKEAKISKASAEKAVNAFTNAVTKALKKGDKLALTGFGTFSVTKRKRRALAGSGTFRLSKSGTGKHIVEPATAHKILKSLKVNKLSDYAIYKRLSD